MIEHVAASQTAQVLGTAGGPGDWLNHLMVVPTTTSPGAVTVLDGAISTKWFDGGASSVGSLVPFPIYIGDTSTTGPWKITTGANVRVIAVGEFQI